MVGLNLRMLITCPIRKSLNLLPAATQSTETARALSFKARPGLYSSRVTMSRIRVLDMSTTLLIICVATRAFSSPLSQHVVKRRFGA